MKYIPVRRFFISGLVLAVGLAMPAAALAHDGENHATTEETRQYEVTPQRGQPQRVVEARLTDVQKRVCESRAKNIEAIMTRGVARVENYGQFFTTITDRVKHFGEDQEKTLDKNGRPTDELLLAAVDTAAAQFKTDVASMKRAATFSCDSDNPKEQIHEFQDAHRTVLQDLKNWRSALKDLIQYYKREVAS